MQCSYVNIFGKQEWSNSENSIFGKLVVIETVN